jgi:hypothetical protein
MDKILILQIPMAGSSCIFYRLLQKEMGVGMGGGGEGGGGKGKEERRFTNIHFTNSHIWLVLGRAGRLRSRPCILLPSLLLPHGISQYFRNPLSYCRRVRFFFFFLYSLSSFFPYSLLHFSLL